MMAVNLFWGKEWVSVGWKRLRNVKCNNGHHDGMKIWVLKKYEMAARVCIGTMDKWARRKYGLS